jgi:hypothetical protein
VSATELIGGDLPRRGAAETAARARTHLPAIIGVALLAIVLYAAFAYGAVGRAGAARIELCVAAAAGLGALGLVWTGTLRLRSSRVAWVAIALLVGFACWSGVSLVWSVAPDQTWIEVNRVIAYVLVLALGMALGTSYAGAVALIARGFLVVALAVTAYALGQKLFPGLHVAGVFSLNQTGQVTRLQAPLGYWNALALFITMGTPIALAMTADRSRTAPGRLLTAAALQVMLITVPFTYSRGGLVALAVALVVGVLLGAEKLRSAVWLVLVALSGLPAILVGLLVHPLSTDNVSLGTREWAGAILALVLVACLVALRFAGRWLMAREARIAISPRRVPTARRIALGLAVLAVVGALAGLAVSSRGLGGSVSHLWQGFVNTRVRDTNNPNRLLSAVSQDRWVWWKEAADAFAARPWGGWGAGSFPVVHLLYRTDILPVQQPHEVPLQFLAETGVIGALMAVGGFLLLLTAAVRSIRRRLAGRERLLAGGLAAAAIAYGVHSLYDWDWNIPALSLPAFLFLGVLVARPEALGPRASRRSAPSSPGVTRALCLIVATLGLCTFALSAELPQLAASRATASLVDAAGHSPASLRTAQAEASSASELDPLSDAGLLAQATLAYRHGSAGSATLYFRDAVGRDPTDAQAWQLLATGEGIIGRVAQARMAAQRAIDLDPMGRYAQRVAAGQLAAAPPASTATHSP